MKFFDRIANSPRVRAHAEEMNRLGGAEREEKAREHPFMTYLAVSRGLAKEPKAELSGKEKQRQILDMLTRTLASAPKSDYAEQFTAIVNIDLGFNAFSPSVEKVIGYSSEELRARPGFIFELIHPDDRDEMKNHFSSPAEETHAPMRFRMQNKSGEYRIIEHTCQVIYDDDEKPVGRLGHNLDITERMEREDELKAAHDARLETQKNFEAVVNSKQFMVSIIDSGGKRIFSNQALSDITGKKENALDGHSPLEEVRPSDRAKVAKTLREAMESKTPRSTTFRILHQDGSYRWDHATAVPVLDAAGGYDHMIVIGNDITSIMKTQASLAESEEKFRSIVEKTHDTIFIMQEGKIVFANAALLRNMDYTLDEMMELDPIALIHPKDAAQVAENARLRAAGGEVPETYEMRVKGKNGQEYDVLFSTTVIPYGGKPAVLGLAIDITESKRMRIELQNSEARYRMIFHEFPVPMAELDIDGKFVMVNDAYAEMFGYAKDGMAGLSVRDITHLDDIEMTDNAIKAVRRRMTGYLGQRRSISPKTEGPSGGSSISSLWKGQMENPPAASR